MKTLKNIICGLKNSIIHVKDYIKLSAENNELREQLSYERHLHNKLRDYELAEHEELVELKNKLKEYEATT